MFDPGLKAIIQDYVQYLDLADTGVPSNEGDVLLATLACVESAFGANVGPRFEPSYAPGGRTYKRSQLVRQLFAKYGRAAACSYGPFQIMYPTAWGLGFRDAPAALADPRTNCKLAVDYLNAYALCFERITLEEIADCYNSGSPWDNVRPLSYISKFVAAYRGLARKWIREA